MSLVTPEFDRPVKLLLVAAPFDPAICDILIDDAQTHMQAHDISWDMVQVPGAFEIPTAIGFAERQSNFDGYVALGSLSCNSDICDNALQLLGLHGACIGNGILRSGEPAENKGSAAVDAALHLIALTRKWGKPTGKVGFYHKDEIKLA